MSVSIPRFARRLWSRAAGDVSRDELLDEEFLRRLERLSLAVRRPASGGIGGEHRSVARAPSTDFADYREYQPGDDFRRIDWNAYGRLGQLYVKLTEAREQVALHVLLDASGSMDWGEPSKLHYGQQLAASIAYLALARYDRVGVTCLGERGARFDLVRGRARFHDLLRFLGRQDAAGALQMDRALGEYRAHGRRRGEVVLISDLLAPEGYQAGLDRLLQLGYDVVVVQVLSPQELELEPGGDLELIDAETGEVLEVSLTQKTVAQYRERLDRWCADVQAFCTQRGIRYVRARTDTPFDELLFDAFRRALILR